MRIALDGRTIQDHFPGIGRYTYNLALALTELDTADEIVLLHNQQDANSRFDLDRLRARPNLTMVEAHSAYFSPVEQWRIPRVLRRQRCSVYHSPYYLMPYLNPCPAVVTIHDLIPILYPHYFTAMQRMIFNVSVRLAARSARVVVADSEATAADLRRRLTLDPRKVRVVLAAADPSLTRSGAEAIEGVRLAHGLGKPYVLYVGSNKPHKNLTRLVEAWSQVKERERAELVIAGPWDQAYDAPKAAAQRLGIDREIRWLGSIPQFELAALYSGCAVFAFPSEYEGFGLPVLEAMACGAPVVCSDCSSLPEVAADAAILVAPDQSAPWAEAIERLLGDAGLRADMARRSLLRARELTWAASARRMREIYDHAIIAHQ